MPIALPNHLNTNVQWLNYFVLLIFCQINQLVHESSLTILYSTFRLN